jgi:hypothetical protein
MFNKSLDYTRWITNSFGYEGVLQTSTRPTSNFAKNGTIKLIDDFLFDSY